MWVSAAVSVAHSTIAFDYPAFGRGKGGTNGTTTRAGRTSDARRCRGGRVCQGGPIRGRGGRCLIVRAGRDGYFRANIVGTVVAGSECLAPGSNLRAERFAAANVATNAQADTKANPQANAE